MSLKQGLFLTVLTSALIACGGGSDGYYSGSNDNNNTPTTPNTDLAKAQLSLDTLKREGQFLFGNYDPNDASTPKGYIDHALDTFAHGPLQLAIDAKKLFDTNRSNFYYRDKCMETGFYSNTGCYILFGNDEIKKALNSVNPQKYTSWDFDVNDNEVDGMKLTSEQIDQFTGKTMIIIFDNRNTDKKYNDVWVTGVFAYPYKQSWGLNQTDQLRVVSMNESSNEYNVTLTYQDETTETRGALSIYKDPTSLDGDLYVLQNDSSFNVLINDNPNTPNAEPVSFTINSTPGSSSSLATYRIKSNLDKVLSIPSLTAVSGSRIENENPNSAENSFDGNVYLEGQRIFDFKQALNGSILKFKHTFDGITFEGISTNNSGNVNTTLSTPTNLKF